MTATPQQPDADLDAQVARWRDFVRQYRAISPRDLDEGEDHLRAQVAQLRRAGLSADEAFLVAVKRIGTFDEGSPELAQERSDRLWEQLVLSPGATAGSAGHRGNGADRELAVVLGLAVAAALAIKLSGLFGMGLFGVEPTDDAFYARNLSLFVLPFLAGYFAWKRRLGWSTSLLLLVPPFVVATVVANAYPFDVGGSTEALVAIHLPIALWFVVGLAYVGGDWRSHRRRMDFIRFTGEWVVYYTLLALGGGLLVALTTAAFNLVGFDATTVMAGWVLPCGAMGAVLVAAWLVEAKQAVVENIAPVLTRVFTPLTTGMLVSLLVATLSAGVAAYVDRGLLILVDVILVLVLGLLLYAISARDPLAPPGPFDWLQLLLVGSALAVDVLMLAAMLSRIGEFGATANKVAALGLNLMLLVNLGWAAWLAVGFVRGRRPFAAVERWQTGYLPVYAAWAAVVVVVLPPVFGFV